MQRRHALTRPLAWLAAALVPGSAAFAASAAKPPDPLACLVPAKAGGGFDLTCKMAAALLDHAKPGPSLKTLDISYLPGGIGALAFDRMTTGKLANPNTLVAFSSGSLLNLAQGKFGPHSAADVRWLAAIATDYGVIVVHKDSPIQSLSALGTALKKDLASVIFGAGGTVGSQDWIKAALIVKAAGKDHKSMRFVSFEGGGDAMGALAGQHVTVFCGDLAEVVQAIRAGAPLRVLAVLAAQRLPGTQAHLPTAREQGVNLVWPTVRGLYVSRNVSDATYQHWASLFATALNAPGLAPIRERYGVYPFALTGQALEDFVQEQIKTYAVLASELGLRVRP